MNLYSKTPPKVPRIGELSGAQLLFVAPRGPRGYCSMGSTVLFKVGPHTVQSGARILFKVGPTNCSLVGSTIFFPFPSYASLHPFLSFNVTNLSYTSLPIFPMNHFNITYTNIFSLTNKIHTLNTLNSNTFQTNILLYSPKRNKQHNKFYSNLSS